MRRPGSPASAARVRGAADDSLPPTGGADGSGASPVGSAANGAQAADPRVRRRSPSARAGSRPAASANHS